MKAKGLICLSAVLHGLALLPETFAGTIAIRETPVLTAALVSNATYQIESSVNGTVWNSTGVLVAGNGSAMEIRLDGYPETLSYRFSRIAAAGTVPAVKSRGLHLANTFPGVPEVRIEAAPETAGNTWTHHGFVFPDTSGSFLSALRPPFLPREFFRGVQPGAPLDLASISSAPLATNTGVAGFGIVADEMPQLFRDGFLCAPCPAFYNRGGTNAAAAGETYEFTGPCGTTTAMVSDIGDVFPAGTCDAGQSFFYLSGPAFSNIMATASGVGTATYRLVPAPVTGNVKIVVALYFSPGSFIRLRPYNHRAGISKLEIRGPVGGGTGGNWIELPRVLSNGFDYAGAPPGFPLDIRITSRFGEVIQLPPIASMAEGARFSANDQFVVFPPLDPTPVWFPRQVYKDSLTNQYGTQWTVSAGGATINPTNSTAPLEGAACLQIQNFAAFNIITFSSPQRFPMPADGYFEFGTRTLSALPAGTLGISFLGFTEGGVATNSSIVSLPAISTAWNVFRIQLNSARVPARIREFRLHSQTAMAPGTLFLDRINFQPR